MELFEKENYTKKELIFVSIFSIQCTIIATLILMILEVI